MNKLIIIRTLKIVIILLSFWFIGKKLWLHQDWLSNNAINISIVITIFICAIIYGFSEFLLSFAWRRLLIWCGHKKISIKKCNTIYGKSQIAKYIPGNVFHMVSRHVLGNQAGIKHIVLVGASIYAILGLIITSILIGFGGMIIFNLTNSFFSLNQSMLIIFLAVLFSIFINVIAPSLMRSRGVKLPYHNLTNSVGYMSLVYLSYFIFFITAGLLLVFIVKAFIHINFFDASKIMVIFSIAWLTGFVVPGAPGGIGVRETVIIFFIAPIIGEAQGVTVAIALRFVTLLGDIFYFMVSDKIINFK